MTLKPLDIFEPLPCPNTLKSNEEFILIGCQYILNLRLPIADSPNGFVNDLAMPVMQKTMRIGVAKDIIHMRELISHVIDSYLVSVGKKIRCHESPIEILREYATQWNRFKISRQCLDTCIISLFIIRTQNSQPDMVQARQRIKTFFYDRWRKSLLIPFRKIIQKALHGLINDFRDSNLHSYTSNSSDIVDICAVINSYQELDPGLSTHYVEDFETPFLDDTNTYYSVLCMEYLQKESISSYLAMCDRILDLEELVASRFLNSKTHERHRDIVNLIVIINHNERLQNAMADFVQNSQTDELAKLYRLFTRIDNIDPLLKLFANFAKDIFEQVFKDLIPLTESEDKNDKELLPNTYCINFLTQYHRLMNVINVSFKSNMRFESTLEKKAREMINNNVINRPDDRAEPTARFVAKYSDYLLTNPKLSFQDLIDDTMNLPGVIFLFKIVASKDVFCKSYKVWFMNRLLRNKITHKDGELYMVNQMKTVHDTRFAQELTIMYQDMNTSKEKYGAESNFLTTRDVVCDPVLLTTDIWPISSYDKTICMNLPPQIEDLSARFIERYQQMNDGKTVEWIHERSTALIDFRPRYEGAKVFHITMNHFQASVFMMLSNTAGKFYSTDEIVAHLNLHPDWTVATLNSLSGAKLLQQNPKTKVWRINPDFKVPNIILNAALRFQKPVVESTIDPQIEEQRELNTQAAIVRIMKARRVLEHSVLCEETTKQTSRFFPQTIERIKRQIEKLINGQEKYIEREDARTYRYVTGAVEDNNS